MTTCDASVGSLPLMTPITFSVLFFPTSLRNDVETVTPSGTGRNSRLFADLINWSRSLPPKAAMRLLASSVAQAFTSRRGPPSYGRLNSSPDQEVWTTCHG